MIEVKNLTKYFGQKVAVNNISFSVDRGEVLGFLGPNAAGKSTTMRMITGFLTPSSGTAVIGGDDIVENSLPARMKIGYLPENAPVYPDMTVISFLDFCAEIRGLSGRDKKKRIEETLEKCFLSNVRYETVNTLSKGYKQRVCFAQSILHDPEYLIMDEPTDGLDPNQKHEVRSMIKEMARDKTIILSTHILEEVEAVCTRAIIIADGKIVVDKSPDELKAMSPSHGAFRVVLKWDEKDNYPTDEISTLSFVNSVEKLHSEQGFLTLRIYPKKGKQILATDVLAYLDQRDYKVTSISMEEGRLDEVFRMITSSASQKG